MDINIKKHLTKRKITQIQLAKAMGFSQQMVSHIVNGKRKVPLSKLSAFEKFTGIPREKFRPELFR